MEMPKHLAGKLRSSGCHDARRHTLKKLRKFNQVLCYFVIRSDYLSCARVVGQMYKCVTFVLC